MCGAVRACWARCSSTADAAAARAAARCRFPPASWLARTRVPRARLAVPATLCMCRVSPVCVGVAAPSARPPSGVVRPASLLGPEPLPCAYLHVHPLESPGPHLRRPRPLTHARLPLSVVWRDALPRLPRPLPRPSWPFSLVCRTPLPALSVAASRRPRLLGRPPSPAPLRRHPSRLHPATTRPALVRADLRDGARPNPKKKVCLQVVVSASPHTSPSPPRPRLNHCTSKRQTRPLAPWSALGGRPFLICASTLT